jgi:diacylglycerol kinase
LVIFSFIVLICVLIGFYVNHIPIEYGVITCMIFLSFMTVSMYNKLRKIDDTVDLLFIYYMNTKSKDAKTDKDND